MSCVKTRWADNRRGRCSLKNDSCMPVLWDQTNKSFALSLWGQLRFHVFFQEIPFFALRSAWIEKMETGLEEFERERAEDRNAVPWARRLNMHKSEKGLAKSVTLLSNISNKAQNKSLFPCSYLLNNRVLYATPAFCDSKLLFLEKFWNKRYVIFP